MKNLNPCTTTGHTHRLRQTLLFCLCMVAGFLFVFASLNGLLVKQAVAKPGLNMDKFDPDVYPAIHVLHLPPVMAQVGERVPLKFDFACVYNLEVDTACQLEASLYVAYGPGNSFNLLPVVRERSSPQLAVRVPASDDKGQALRYYVQVYDPEVNVRVRYPQQDSIEVALTPKFSVVDLSTAQARVLPGERVLSMPWGKGPEQVGLRGEGEQPLRGPDALAVAPDGKLALLDHGNSRVIVFDPATRTFRRYAAPLKGVGHAVYDTHGQLLVMDLVGERLDSGRRAPQLYRLSPGGQIELAAPVFAALADDVFPDGTVLDAATGRQVRPMSPTGQARSRQEQRQGQVQRPLLSRLVDGYTSRFMDTRRGVAFEIRDNRGLGPIARFVETAHGYVVVFQLDNLRVLWLDQSGRVRGQASIANPEYADLNPTGKVAVGQDETVYVLSSTSAGIEIRSLQLP